MHRRHVARIIAASVALLLAPGGGGAAAQGVKDPCVHDPEVGPITTQVRACSRRRYEEAAATLARVLVEVRAQVGDSAAAARRNALEKSQSAWRGYRTAACEAAYLEIYPGNFAIIHRFDCLRRLTDERVVELRRTYFPDP